MSDYIKRDTLMSKLEERLMCLRNKYGDNDPYTDGYEECLCAIENAAAADVAPVKHGQWRLYGADKRGRGGVWMCTGCKGLYPYKNRYCPNCGAKMDEDEHIVNKVYIYKSHLGGLYVETDGIPWDDLYCKVCGASDELLFSTDNLEDVAKYFRDEGEMYLISDIQSVYNICETLLKEE